MQYLISYIAVGAFFGIIGAINNRSLGFLGIPRLLLIVIFWPLIVIIAPDDLLKKNVIDELKSQDNLDDISRSFQSISEGDLVALNEEERLRVERTKFFGNSGTTFFSDSTNFDDVLNRFWIDEIPPEAYKSLNLARWRLNDDFVVDSDIRYSLRQPDWFVGFSTEFVKSITKVDKNKRARILDAIGRIAEAPISPHGDTVKSLTGDHAGLWRYRIGDDRLVYKPDSDSKKIVLISFGARGGIYE